METQEQSPPGILEGLKEILEVSYPHCDDGNPNEDAFVKINNLAHDCLVRAEHLRIIQEAV